MFRKSRLLFRTRGRYHRNLCIISPNLLIQHRHFVQFEFLKFVFLSCGINFTMDSSTFKPPNILVYTGENFNNGDPVIYRNIAKNINRCLHPDCYTTFLLTPLQVINEPWEENVACLVISCGDLGEEISDAFRKYLISGGKILNFGCKFDFSGISFKEYNESSPLTPVHYNRSETWVYSCKVGIATTQSSDIIATDMEGNARIIKMAFGTGTVVVSDVHLEMDESVLDCDEQMLDVLKDHSNSRIDILINVLHDHFGLLCVKEKQKLMLTPCFLLTENNETELLLNKSDSPRTLKKVNVTFYDFSQTAPPHDVTENELPIFYNCPEEHYLSAFNKNIYFSHLKTENLGQKFFFIDVVGTTMSVIQSLPDIEGAVVSANVQTQGKGRRGNHWITPKGAIAFSTHFSFPLQSPLGQKMSIIQYLVVLSLVKGIREIPGYEDLAIMVKWPNDIYFRKTKIGGVLINSTVQGSTVHVYTGSGMNVNNLKPTLCVNEIIRQYNAETGNNLKTLSCEEIIARSLNELECLIKCYQESNSAYFFTSYYKYWMHLGQKITLMTSKDPATIVGIDQFGYLVVELSDKKKLALQPDGNSFDIMKNLIIVREM